MYYSFMALVEMNKIMIAEQVARQTRKNSSYLKFYSVEVLLGMLKPVDTNSIEPFETEPLTDGEGKLLPHRRGVRIYRR